MMNQEKKNKMTSAYVAFGLHAVLLLFFFFIVAWSEPDPPIPEYGIEFNLGAAFVSNNVEESEPIKAEEIAAEEEVKEEAEEVTETVEEVVEEVVEDIVEPVEAVEDAVTEDVHSPDVVEKKEEKKEKVEEKKEKVEPVKEPTPVVTPAVKAEPKVENRAIMKKANPGSGTGNKGSRLDMSGWEWDNKPKPNDTSTENGYIVFQITVDDEGEIIGVRTLEKTVSPVVEQVYKESVRQLTFSRTADNRTSSSTSTGRITFIIQSN